MIKQNWELMGKPKLIYYPIRLRMANQQAMSPFGRLEHVPVDFDRVRTFADFKMIDIVNFSKSHPVSVSLNFLPNLNSKFSVSTVSSYATAVFQHLLTVVFQHQHMLQPCFSICYSSVSASTTVVFQHLLQQCFSIYYSSVSTSITAVFQHILSTVFQLMLQPGVSA
jgi:hypothetical protein